jgi:hypothetical protein
MIRDYEPKAQAVIQKAQAWRAALPADLPADLPENVRAGIDLISTLQVDLATPNSSVGLILDEARPSVRHCENAQREMKQQLDRYRASLCDTSGNPPPSAEQFRALIPASTQESQSLIQQCQARASCAQGLPAAQVQVQNLDFENARRSIDGLRAGNCDAAALASLEQAYQAGFQLVQEFQGAVGAALASCEFDHAIDASTRLLEAYPQSVWAGAAADSRNKLAGWRGVKDQILADLDAASRASILQEAEGLLAHARSFAGLPCLEALITAAEAEIRARLDKPAPEQPKPDPPQPDASGPVRKSVLDSIGNNTGTSPDPAPRPAPEPAKPSTPKTAPSKPREIPNCSGIITSDKMEGWAGEAGMFTITIGPDMSGEITRVMLSAGGPAVPARSVGGGAWQHGFRFKGIPGDIGASFVAYDSMDRPRCQRSIVVRSKGVPNQ